jgi:hypothetical protein
MADELYKIEGWIPSRVATSAALVALVGAKVFEGRAPQKTATFNPFPCILFALLDGGTSRTMNGTQVMAAPQYKVVVADEGGFSANAYAAMNLLVELFKKVDTDTFESNIFNSRLEDLFTLDETDQRTGVIYKQKGGLFRVESYPV